MLNTKYVVQKGQDGKYMVQKNPGALGNAWLVDEILWVNNAREEIDTLTNFDPFKTAVADIRFKEKLNGFSGGRDSTSSIVLKSYQPNDLVYESNSSTPGMAVFSEIFYDDGKGWQAYLDGNKVTHARVNYILRGMVLPAGKHSIEFKFEPRAYYTGEKISLGMSLLLIVSLFGIGFVEFRKTKKSEND